MLANATGADSAGERVTMADDGRIIGGAIVDGPGAGQAAVTVSFVKSGLSAEVIDGRFEIPAEDAAERQQLFDELVRQAYEAGRATEAASHLEIDAVIDPAETRTVVLRALAAAGY